MYGVVAPKATNINLMATGITAGVADSSAEPAVELPAAEGAQMGALADGTRAGVHLPPLVRPLDVHRRAGSLGVWKVRAMEADLYTFPVAAGIIAGESLMGIFLILLPLIVAFFTGNL